MSALYRYPVKSMSGERVESVDLDGRGCVGDRLWSVRTPDDKMGSGKNSRRFAHVDGLLELRATRADGHVVVRFPDGSVLHADDPDAAARLSAHFGRPLTLVRESDVSQFDDGPVSLLSAASVGAVGALRGVDVDPRRFRANIVLDGADPFAEDTWAGRDIQVGTVVLHVRSTLPRCVMVDMATADLPAQPGNLVAVGRANRACLGVVAVVLTPGRISVGDAVVVA